MSWLFSRALVEVFSAGNCLGGGQYAQLNVMPTQHKFSRQDKMIESSGLSLFGLTCAVLTEDCGAGLLTSFLEAFPVRISARQEGASEFLASDQGCGRNSPGLFAKYDLATSSWKTVQCSLLEDSMLFSGTWPRWGFMLAGECLVRDMPTLLISENGSGWLPTPTASNTKGVHMRGADKGKARPPRTYGCHGPLNPPFLEWLMGWPIGWTSLEPLEMDRFREWRQQHSPCSQRDVAGIFEHELNEAEAMSRV